MAAAYEVMQNERRAIRKNRMFTDRTNSFDVFGGEDIILRYCSSLVRAFASWWTH